MNIVQRWRNSKYRYKLMMWDKHGPLVQWSDREKMILEALRFVKANQVKGDYLEFGVGEGYTFATAIRLAKALDMKGFIFHGFDSFEGLPKLTGFDITQQFKEGDYSFSEEQVRESLPNTDNWTLHKTWFDKLVLWKMLHDCLTYSPGVSVVWIDCDMYQSTVPVLDWITPMLQTGTVLCFDDWNCFKGSPFKGQKLAFRTWSTEHEHELGFTEFLPFGWHGMSFIVHRPGEG